MTEEKAINHPINKPLALNVESKAKVYQLIESIFGKGDLAYDFYKKFILFLREYSGNQIDTITEIETVFQLLKSNLTNSGMGKIESGKIMTKDEREHFALFIKTINQMHDMKYGKKSIVEHRKVGFEDIRKAFVQAEFKEVKDAKNNSKEN